MCMCIHIILQEVQLPLHRNEFQAVGGVGLSNGIITDVQDTCDCVPIGSHTWLIVNYRMKVGRKYYYHVDFDTFYIAKMYCNSNIIDWFTQTLNNPVAEDVFGSFTCAFKSGLQTHC